MAGTENETGPGHGGRPICNAGDPGLIPGLGRSPRGGHGNPLQYSWLENPHGQATVHGVAESDTTEQLNTAHKIDAYTKNW